MSGFDPSIDAELRQALSVSSLTGAATAGRPGTARSMAAAEPLRPGDPIGVTLIRGDSAFTLLGMTWADSDLIQLQENVIAKVVNSMAFAK